MPSTAAEDNPPIPDGPLEDIFLRLDDAADIARASATCASFRGIIKHRAFRSRFARLHHPPPLVGFLELEGPAIPHPGTLHPRSLHHVSTPAARAVAEAADFTCSFLPDPGSWRIRDSSSGRLLLSSRDAATDLTDLMVCDPLHRTFVRVPPVPDHLTAAAGRHEPGFGWFPFLIPLPVPDSEEEEKEPPLQVVWMMNRGKAITAFVFSSSTWEWLRVPTFCSWSGCNTTLSMTNRLYAHGSIYWTSRWFRNHSALKLDVRKMMFSTMQLPNATRPQPFGKNCRTNLIVEASEDELGALVLGDHSLDLYCRNRQGNDDVGAAAAWRHSRTVPLPNELYYNIVAAADGYLLLQAYPDYSELLSVSEARYFAEQTQQARYFSVKLKTLVFEELRVSLNQQLEFVHLYTNFPPLLSLPSVCSEDDKSGQDQCVTGETSDGSRTISSTS